MSDEPADESVPYVQNIKMYDDAEDVKRIRFEGHEKAVEVGITDEVLSEFIEIAEKVFHQIHGDMAEMRDIFDGFREDDDNDRRR